MQDEFSPALDRYVQQDLGRVVRERMAEPDERELPESLGALLEALKGSEQDNRLH